MISGVFKSPEKPQNDSVQSRLSIMFLIWILSFGLNSCNKDFPLIHEDTREKGANVRISDFKRHSVLTDGTPQWYLQSKEAYLFTEKNINTKIIVYEFNMDLFDASGNPSGTITAFRGELNYEEKTINLEGDVEVDDGAGRILQAQKMSYNTETEIIETESEVVLTENGMKTVCRRGIVVDKTKNRQLCRSPIGYKMTDESGESSGNSSSFDNIFN
jgi:LPS export ABC transporter protein LptC